MPNRIGQRISRRGKKVRKACWSNSRTRIDPRDSGHLEIHLYLGSSGLVLS